MTQKTISLNEKAYKVLRKFKGNKESYSDLIIRLCEVSLKIIRTIGNK